MTFKAIEPSRVPAINIVAERLNAISSNISISEAAFDFDRGLYCMRLLGPAIGRLS
jgi:hypothetical protein